MKQSKNKSIKEIGLEKIEDEIDLAIAKKALKENEEKDETISFDEFLEEMDYDSYEVLDWGTEQGRELW